MSCIVKALAQVRASCWMLAGWQLTVQQLAYRLQSFISMGDNRDSAWHSAGEAASYASSQEQEQQARAQQLPSTDQPASHEASELIKLRQHFQKVSLPERLYWPCRCHSNVQRSPAFDQLFPWITVAPTGCRVFQVNAWQPAAS